MTLHDKLYIEVLDAALDEIVEQSEYFERVSGLELAERWGEAVARTMQSLLSIPHRGARLVVSEVLESETCVGWLSTDSIGIRSSTESRRRRRP